MFFSLPEIEPCYPSRPACRLVGILTELSRLLHLLKESKNKELMTRFCLFSYRHRLILGNTRGATVEVEIRIHAASMEGSQATNLYVIVYFFDVQKPSCKKR
jgi:hypothetical protein